ncbi:MAG: hypothetical protein ACJAVU_002103 [Cognaticolwellia sp.]|jgi:hypothetical protein
MIAIAMVIITLLNIVSVFTHDYSSRLRQLKRLIKLEPQ